MRRLLRTAALACALGGGAIWFFGGMNTGPSQWAESGPNEYLTETAAPDAADHSSRERFVIRPGPGFLLITTLTAAALFAASWLTPRPRPS